MTKHTLTTATDKPLPQPPAKNLFRCATMTRLIFVALSLMLAMAGTGCCTHQTHVPKVVLYGDPIGLSAGASVVLKAKPDLSGKKDDWKYQWQQVIDLSDEGELIVSNVPDGNTSQLILKDLKLSNTGLYRCLIYKEGKFGETNHTTMYSLQVSTSSSTMANSVSTIVSGTFQPGNGGGSCTCCKSYRDGIIFKCNNSNWWIEPGSAGTGTATITDQSTGVNYATTPVFLEIVDENFNTLLCQKLPGMLQFHATRGGGYMICLHFTNPLPPTGHKFQFTINWPH
jgi:hypothetical protein